MKTILGFWWVAVILDFYSTIIYWDCSVEENPIVRYFWCNYGNFGLVAFDLFVGILVSFLIYWLRNLKGIKIIYFAFIILIIFKILIGLTNLAWIPYWILAWFNF